MRPNYTASIYVTLLAVGSIAEAGDPSARKASVQLSGLCLYESDLVSVAAGQGLVPGGVTLASRPNGIVQAVLYPGPSTPDGTTAGGSRTGRDGARWVEAHPPSGGTYGMVAQFPEHWVTRAADGRSWTLSVMQAGAAETVLGLVETSPCAGASAAPAQARSNLAACSRPAAYDILSLGAPRPSSAIVQAIVEREPSTQRGATVATLQSKGSPIAPEDTYMWQAAAASVSSNTELDLLSMTMETRAGSYSGVAYTLACFY